MYFFFLVRSHASTDKFGGGFSNNYTSFCFLTPLTRTCKTGQQTMAHLPYSAYCLFFFFWYNIRAQNGFYIFKWMGKDSKEEYCMNIT